MKSARDSVRCPVRRPAAGRLAKRPGPEHRRLHCERLEDRAVPAGLVNLAHDEPLAGAALMDDSAFVGTVDGSGAAAQGTPTNAANLGAVRQTYGDTTGAGYAVAVLDTGVDYNNPALGGGLGKGKKVVAGKNFVDTRVGGYVSDQKYPSDDPMDENGHGTHVAGIIAASGTADGKYDGVAPDANIVALRVLDKNGRGTWDWVEDALQYVLDNRTKYNIVAVNMSLGSGNYDGPTDDLPALEELLAELNDAGVSVIASGGNDFYTNKSDQGLQYPAISDYVTSVGAVWDAAYKKSDGSFQKFTWSSGAEDYQTYADKVASFTQRSQHLDLMAPGATITSTYLSKNKQASYATYAGSSQAAPFVTGAVVLAREALDAAGKKYATGADAIEKLLEDSGKAIKDNAAKAADNVTATGRTFRRLDILSALEDASAALPVDRFEGSKGNDTLATAASLGQVSGEASFAQLSWDAPTDSDYYKFTVKAAGTYRFQVETAEEAGDSSLGVYDPTTGKTVYGRAADGVTSLEKALSVGTTYTVVAAPPRGEVSPYELDIYDAAVGNNPPGDTPSDPYEANDSQGKAKYLGNLSDYTADGAVIGGSDQDWFLFTAKTAGTLPISITLTDAGAEAEVSFIDVSKNNPRTITAKTVNGVATLSPALRTSVNYFVKVRSLDGMQTTYRLDFGDGESRSSGGGGTGGGVAKDTYESNDSQTAAKHLGTFTTGSVKNLSLHQGDADWFLFGTGTAGTRSIKVVADDPNVSLRLTFKDVSKNNPRTITADSSKGTAALDVSLRTKVNYLLSVTSLDGKAVGYRIEFGGPSGAGASGGWVAVGGVARPEEKEDTPTDALALYDAALAWWAEQDVKGRV